MALSLQEFRRSYPQYDDMSDGDLTQALHQKFYSDIPFEDFSSQIGVRPVEDEPESSIARRWIADPLITGVKGAIGLTEGFVGLANIPTLGRAGKVAEAIGYRPKEAKEILSTFLTPEQQEANRAVSEAEGFLPTIAASLQRPSTIAHAAIEAVPSIIGGGVIARGLRAVAPKVAPVIAGAVGEGTISAGYTAESIRQQTESGTLTPSQAALAAGSGFVTGAITGVSGKVAQKLGIGDIETILAGGGSQATKKGAIRRIFEGMLTEGVLEELPQSAQEQIAQNLALGKPWDDGVAEAAAIGVLAGGLIGGVVGGISGKAGIEPTSEPPDEPPDTGFAPTTDLPPGTPPQTDEQIVASITQAPTIDAAIQTSRDVVDGKPAILTPIPRQGQAILQPGTPPNDAIRVALEAAQARAAVTPPTQPGIIDAAIAAATPQTAPEAPGSTQPPIPAQVTPVTLPVVQALPVTPTAAIPAPIPVVQAPAVAVTKADIHALADRLFVPWDNAPAFLQFTKSVTGKEHLDVLSQAELKKVWNALPDFAARAVHATDMRKMASEAGWAAKGGSIIRDGVGASAEEIAQGRASEVGAVIGRTKWIPNAEWYQGMRQSLGAKGLTGKGEIQMAVNQWLAGAKLGKRSQATVDWMLAKVETDRVAYAEQQGVADDLSGDVSVPDLSDSGLEVSGQEMVIADLMATAAAIDDAATESAAIRYGDDDAGLITELKRIINEQARPTDKGAEADVTGKEDSVAPEGFDLDQPTAADLQAKADKVKAAEDEKAKAQAKEDKAKADKEEADRIKKNVDTLPLVLGQTPEEVKRAAESGMDDMLGQPAFTPMQTRQEVQEAAIVAIERARAGTLKGTGKLTPQVIARASGQLDSDNAPDFEQVMKLLYAHEGEAAPIKPSVTKKPTRSDNAIAEKAAFYEVTTDDRAILAAGKGVEEFQTSAEIAIKMLLDENKASPGFADLLTRLDDVFWKAAYKQALHNYKEIEKNKNRDPAIYAGALAAAIGKAAPNTDNVQFEIGFKHALAGKTRSTLPSGDAYQFGYLASREWMKTTEGSAWYEGKRINKLENTGADLRRWWDQVKKDLDAANISDMDKAWALIEKATTRANVFNPAIPADATPGVTLYVERLRSDLRTFKEFLVHDLLAHTTGTMSYTGRKRRYGQRASDMDKIRAYLMPQGEGLSIDVLTREGAGGGPARYVTQQQTLEERLATVKVEAEFYNDHLKKLSDALDGVKTVPEAAKIVADLIGRTAGSVVIIASDSSVNKFGQDLDQKLMGGVLDRFTDTTRAHSWLSDLIKRELTVGLVQRKDALRRPKLDKITRNGLPDVRKGESVTPQQFKDRFGFADVGFGGYVAARQDQDHLNYAYDALTTLADTLGMPYKAIGLAKGLHFTIGALGHGRHSAHFSPAQPHPAGGTVPVINVTNTNGDGSVAHEWTHHLDSAVSTPRTDKATFEERHWRQHKVIAQVVAALKSKYMSFEEIEQVANRFLKHGSYYPHLRTAGKVKNAERGLNDIRNTKRTTDYKTEADKLGKDYWGNDLELLARASEGYVYDKLKAKQANDDYLVSNWVEDGKVTGKTHRGTPYLAGAERVRAAVWLDAMFKSMTFTADGVTVDEAKFNELRPKEKEAFDENIKIVISNLESMFQEAEKEAAAKKAERDQLIQTAKEAEEAILKQQAEELKAKLQQQAQTVETTVSPNAELTDDELSNLFDEASAEMDEAKQEEGRNAQIAENKANLIAEIAENKAKRDALMSGRDGKLPDAYLNPLEVIATWTEAYPDGMMTSKDKVFGGIIDRSIVAKAWFYTSHNDAIPPAEGFKTRKEAYEALQSAVRELIGQAAPKPTAPDPTAAALIKQAAAQGVKGIDEALTGLAKLFGGPGTMRSFPGGLDAETYKKAKPHFEAAVVAFRAAGKTLKDLAKLLIEQFGLGIKPYFMHFVKEAKLTMNLSTEKAISAQAKIAAFVQAKLDRGEKITSQELFNEADKAFGGTQGEGKYSGKDAYDALEMGVNKHVIDGAFSPDGSVSQAVVKINELTQMLDNIPTMTRRDAEMDEFQQFSTPPQFAFLANWVANITPGETYLEPSAGNGGLAMYGKMVGANLVLNELSQRRIANLRELFPEARVFTENGEQLHNILPEDIKPTVAVMNPPFSSTAGRVQGQRSGENGAKHVEQALNRLEAGGRLVAITGNLPAMWMIRIRSTYHVRAIISVSGDNYKKYGTTFDNQLVIIDKTPRVAEHKTVTGSVTDIAELPAMLEGIRNDRIQPKAAQISQPIAVERDSADLPGQDGLGAGLDDSGGVADAMGTGSTGDGNQQGVAKPGRPGKPGVTTVKDGAKAGDPLDTATPGSRPGGRGTGVVPAGLEGTEDAGTRGPTIVGDRVEQDGRIEVLNKEGVTTRAEEISDAIFDTYVPHRLEIPGAQPHKGKLVESSAMAAVNPPVATYSPNLAKEVITKGWLSIAQLEGVVRAGQAFSKIMRNGVRRGFFVGDGPGAGKGRIVGGVILDNMNSGDTKAVWISATAGLLEAAQRDFQDIGGDPSKLFDFGGTNKTNTLIKQKDGIAFISYKTLSTNKPPHPGAAKDETKGRLAQLVRWLGVDFAGVIAFDEAHKMGNGIAIQGARGSSKPSQMALAGIELQRLLPNAKILLVSATGATEVANLAYADRLGLWGEGTSFPDKRTFIGEMLRGGVAAMELIAQNMKAMGSYIARSLSYEGVTFRRLPHDLSSLQKDVYNEYAKAWQIVLKNINQALVVTGQIDNAAARKAAKSQFFSTQQRFFNQVITSMMLPTILKDAKEQITLGNAAIFQFVNTNEAEQERQVAQAQEDDTPLEEFDFSPVDALITMVKDGFPVQQTEEHTDADGNVITTLVVDSNGDPVLNKEAVAMRDALLATLEQLTDLGNPIDMILESLGPENVAEISGRKRRFLKIKQADGSFKKVEQKRGKAASAADAEAFMDDKKQALIFTAAGGTGYSYHASNDRKNQRQRVHYLGQGGWRADAVVQGQGRSHRTNQKSAPEYVLPMTEIPGHKRFISSIARRLDQLGALTKGQRQTGSQGLFTAADNLESKYAEAAVDGFFNDLFAGRIAMDGVPTYYLVSHNTPDVELTGTRKVAVEKLYEVKDQYEADKADRRLTLSARFDSAIENMLASGIPDNDKIADFMRKVADRSSLVRMERNDVMSFTRMTEQMGLEIVDPRTGALSKTKKPTVQRFMNRILMLELDVQDRVFHEFFQRLEEGVQQAIQNGTFDEGIQTVRALKVVKNRDEVVHTDQDSGAETRYIELTLTHPTHFTEFEEAEVKAAEAGANFAGYFLQVKTNHVFALINRGDRMDEKGNLVTRGIKINASGRQQYIDTVKRILKNARMDASEYREVSTGEASTLWNKQIAEAPKTFDEQSHMVVGAILPVWDRLLGETKISRAQTETGEMLIGRTIANKDVKKTLQNLGVGSAAAQLSADKILEKVLGGDTAVLSNGWEVKRARVNNEMRIEIVDPSRNIYEADIAQLEKQGAFRERIQWVDRIFIPTGENMLEVFKRITESKPVVDMLGKEGKDAIPAFSRTEPSTGGMSVQSLRAAVSEAVNNLSVPVLYHADVQAMRDATGVGIPDGTRGMFYSGKGHLIASENSSVAEAQETLWHEVLHAGVTALYPNHLAAPYVAAMNSISFKK